MQIEPRKEHQWLQKLVGEWTYEVEATMGPEKPPEKFSGSESARAIGGIWVQCEGRGQMCEGNDLAVSLLTLGYDPEKEKYVGTWIGSMIAYLWVYEGSLDASEKVLTLNAEGPNFAAQGKLAKFKDVIEFDSDDNRTLTSHMLGDDGAWHKFMTARYSRKK